MDKKDVNIYKIINRLESFHSKYFEKNNIYISDLYDYILRAANERIGPAAPFCMVVGRVVRTEIETVGQLFRMAIGKGCCEAADVVTL